MFERISQLAEQSATRASRREFLGRIGRGAMAMALATAGMLVLPRDAQAAQKTCRSTSDTYCRGLVQGAHCQIGTTSGTCQGAPACRCVPVRGGRGGGR